jgi:hypothetical protein
LEILSGATEEFSDLEWWWVWAVHVARRGVLFPLAWIRSSSVLDFTLDVDLAIQTNLDEKVLSPFFNHNDGVFRIHMPRRTPIPETQMHPPPPLG